MDIVESTFLFVALKYETALFSQIDKSYIYIKNYVHDGIYSKSIGLK